MKYLSYYLLCFVLLSGFQYQFYKFLWHQSLFVRNVAFMLLEFNCKHSAIFNFAFSNGIWITHEINRILDKSTNISINQYKILKILLLMASITFKNGILFCSGVKISSNENKNNSIMFIVIVYNSIWIFCTGAQCKHGLPLPCM